MRCSLLLGINKLPICVQERLEIVTETWVREGRVPSFEEVSKAEGAALLRPYGTHSYLSYIAGWCLANIRSIHGTHNPKTQIALGRD